MVSLFILMVEEREVFFFKYTFKNLELTNVQFWTFLKFLFCLCIFNKMAFWLIGSKSCDVCVQCLCFNIYATNRVVNHMPCIYTFCFLFVLFFCTHYSSMRFSGLIILSLNASKCQTCKKKRVILQYFLVSNPYTFVIVCS